MRNFLHVFRFIIARSPVFLIALMASMLIDTSLSTSLCITLCFYTLEKSLPIFFSITVFFVAIQFMLIRRVGSRVKRISLPTFSKLKVIHNTALILQLILVAIIGVTLAQIIFDSYYTILTLVVVTVLSYSFSLAMLSLLAQRFFSWFRSNRNFVVLGYAFASATLAANL